jgi:hypothetical protein
MDGSTDSTAGYVGGQDPFTSKQSKSRRGKASKAVTAGTVGARVNVEALSPLVRLAEDLGRKFGAVRKDLEAINNLSNRMGSGGAHIGSAPGVTATGQKINPGVPTPTNPLVSDQGSIPLGMLVPSLRGAVGGAANVLGRVGQFNAGARSAAFGSGMAWVADKGLDVLSDRFGRNFTDSLPISATSSLMSSMYGAEYSTIERRRLVELGKFAGNRQDALAAQQIGLSYGQTYNNASGNFLRNVVAPMVQASGGTMSSSQAAQSAGAFLDARTMNQALAFGIRPGKMAGVVGNPLQTGLGYVKKYEEMHGVRLNEADYANLRDPGNGHRLAMMRMFQLDEAEMDMIIQAGLQNNQFRSTPASKGRDINFSSSADLKAIGMTQSRLGLKAISYLSTVSGRESNFFSRQEDNMVGRLGTEESVQKALGWMEDGLQAVIGKLHEFERVITGVITVVGGLMAARGLSGFFGGGSGAGGFGGLLGGAGGKPWHAGGAPASMLPGSGLLGPNGQPIASAATAAGSGGGMGGGMLMGAAKQMGGGVMAAAGTYAAAHGAKMAYAGGSTGGLGVGVGAFGGAAAGAGVALMAGMAVPPLAIAGAVAGGAYALYKWNEGKKDRARDSGAASALTMTEKELLAALSSYHDKEGEGTLLNTHVAGLVMVTDKDRGRMDTLQRRRAALIAAALDEIANDTDFLDNTQMVKDGEEAKEFADLLAFFRQGNVHVDKDWDKNANKLQDKWLPRLRNHSASVSVLDKFFGPAMNPFVWAPITTTEADSLVLSNKEVAMGVNPSPTGDGSFAMKSGKTSVFQSSSKSSSPSSNPSWDRLDSRMKSRLEALISASNGQVSFGGGWRSTESQQAMFLDRHYVDPNGSIEWNGQKWSLKAGQAPAAPPGRSMHEIGLAADLQGPGVWNGWLDANAGRFGLKTFTNVPNNNERWHVQLAELPNSRREYEGAGGDDAFDGWVGDGGTSGTGSSATSGAGGSGGGYGGIAGSASSGVNYSIANSMSMASALGLVGGGTSALGNTAAGNSGGSSWSGQGSMTMEQVAQVAYNAGFRGVDLVRAVAIAWRESRGNPTAHNPDRSTGDDSYGLWQINLLPGAWDKWAAERGITGQDLLDPNKAAAATFAIWQQSGWHPWVGYREGIGWDSEALATNLPLAQAAVTNAGLGDGTFALTDRGSRSGGATHIHVTVHANIQASGRLEYDAAALTQAAEAGIGRSVETMNKRRGGL